MTEDQLIDDVFHKEGRKYGDKNTVPPIDQPTAAGGIVLDTLQDYVQATGAPLEVSVATLKNLTSETARPIVQWKLQQVAKRYQIDKIEYEPLRLQMIDFAYNSGSFAVRWLQRVVRVTPDGVMGQKTLTIVNGSDGWLVHHALIGARLQMMDMWTDADQRRKVWEEGLENRALTFSMLLELP